jgi:hypothetical protein
MIAAPPLIGRMAVQNQRDAIALEQTIRAHVWLWLDTLDCFDRPSLAHPRLRRLEQAVRDAEYAEQWEAVEQAWHAWLECLREMQP